LKLTERERGELLPSSSRRVVLGEGELSEGGSGTGGKQEGEKKNGEDTYTMSAIAVTTTASYNGGWWKSWGGARRKPY